MLVTTQLAGQPVQEVRFQGNRSFSARVLGTVVSVKPGTVVTEAAMGQDARALEKFYEGQGFFDAVVERGVGMVQGRLVVTFSINEGPATRIGQVTIHGNRAFATERLLRLLPIGNGQFLRAAGVQEAVRVLIGYYANAGYPFAKVTSTVVRSETLATVQLDIEEGPQCYIKEVRVRGNQKVGSGSILRTAELRQGERYSQRRLYDAQRRLYATKLFYRVLFSVSRPDSASDSVVVRFDVVEQPARAFAFGAGFETPPLRGLVSVEWEHDNMFNRGQTVETGVQFSPDVARNYRISVDATYRVPYLFFTRIDFQTHSFFYREQIDSRCQREYGIETGMSRAVLPQLRFGMFNRIRLVADTAHGITNLLAFSSIYDSRDDLFDPHQGLYVQPGAEVAGGLLAGDNDFYRVTADVRVYQAIGWGFVLAARGMVGRVFPYGRTEQVPYYEEFFLGGRNSLRGYPDKSVGPDSGVGGRYGPEVINANLEVRGPYFFRWVGLVVFADGGVVTGGKDHQFDQSQSAGLRAQLEYGAGVGVRVRTPIGPVRLDWGKRLKEPPAQDWGRLYLGLLHAF